MEPNKSIEIFEHILKESQKSLHRNSFYFILWGGLMSLAALLGYFISNQYQWMAWPALSIIGVVISSIYGNKESKRAGSKTTMDRIASYTWGAFAFTLVFAILFSIYNHISPYSLVLMLAGSATFISGGISRYIPLVIGGIALEAGAMLSAFLIEPAYHPIVFTLAILAGYIIPGMLLRKVEHEQA